MATSTMKGSLWFCHDVLYCCHAKGFNDRGSGNHSLPIHLSCREICLSGPAKATAEKASKAGPCALHTQVFVRKLERKAVITEVSWWRKWPVRKGASRVWLLEATCPSLSWLRPKHLACCKAMQRKRYRGNKPPGPSELVFLLLCSWGDIKSICTWKHKIPGKVVYESKVNFVLLLSMGRFQESFVLVCVFFFFF